MKKKKITAKDRAAKKAQASASWSEKNRKAEEEKRETERKRQEEEAKKERDRQLEQIRKENPELSEKKKSPAKAAGLKSTFYIRDDRVLLTSFGKGNDAVREAAVLNENGQDRVKILNQGKALNIGKVKDKHFPISGRSVSALPDDPRGRKKKRPGDDLIFCKEKLEELYFGKPFEDNIHIQLIHCIQDIEKILAVHINNIEFSLNNLLRIESPENGEGKEGILDDNDLIGYLSLDKSYDAFSECDNCDDEKKKNCDKEKKKHCKQNKEIFKLFRELAWKPQRGYYGAILRPGDKKSDDDKKNNEHLKECYKILAFIGSIRQTVCHFDGRNRAKLYRPDSQIQNNKGCWKEALKNLDDLYESRVKEVNKNFLNTSGKDRKILYGLFDADSDQKKQAITQEYYRFLILKEYKTLGFSIKRLRETFIQREEAASWIASDDYSTVRRKLYHLVDFVIWKAYMEKPENAAALVEKLRASATEIEKEYIYEVEAKKLWKTIQPRIERLRPKMKGSDIAKMTMEAADENMIAGIALTAENTHSFSKIIYLMTCFMDGKEINDLLTQLISKFENIAAFVKVLEEEGLSTDFREEYTLFLESNSVAAELRAINSFARMSSPAEETTVKAAMMREAAEVLGYKGKDLDDYIKNMMDPKGGELVNGRKDNNFRNFIINNVIESRRFLYLVRYGNPKKIRSLAGNKDVILFVLKGIPDSQILRYYNSYYLDGKKDECDANMREELANLITGISFKKFEKVHQSNGATAEQSEDKERKKSLVNLYLTVLYLLLKNLVYINSRYFMAFYCQERDSFVYRFKPNKEDENDRTAFAKKFLNDHPQKKRVQSYLDENMKHSDPWAVRTFRNDVMHLNVLRNLDQFIKDVKEVDSYYGLYHYLLQRTINNHYHYDVDKGKMTEASINDAMREYFGLIEKHGTYCKDFVKALNTPFAYNLPRYKNLSIKELFDRNDYHPEEAGDQK